MITIKVDKESIKNGKRGSCSRCPIALAASKVIEGITTIVIGKYSMSYFAKGEWFNAALPRCATMFIINFDAGLIKDNTQVIPFEFNIIPRKIQ